MQRAGKFQDSVARPEDLHCRQVGKVSPRPRKSVVQPACQYYVTSRVSDFQNGEQSVHRGDGLNFYSDFYCFDFLDLEILDCYRKLNLRTFLE